MSVLKVFHQDGREKGEKITDHNQIADSLKSLGVRFERWKAEKEISNTSTQEEILEAYRESIDALKKEYGFQSMDVASITPDHPEKKAFREKFLNEHIHDDFEVRFFVDGSGLFYIHAGESVYTVLCEKGDLISVPAKVPHWFDMGENPFFKCIRLFTRPDGWVANFTGSDITQKHPGFESFLAATK